MTAICISSRVSPLKPDEYVDVPGCESKLPAYAHAANAVAFAGHFETLSELPIAPGNLAA